MMKTLLCLLTLLCCGRACFECDRRVRRIHEDFLLSVSPGDVGLQMDMRMIIGQGYVFFRETSQRLGGIVDPTTLYRASTEYQSEFNRFKNNPGRIGIEEMLHMMGKGVEILQKHLENFIQTGLCPNRCGLLYQRVMDCTSCQYQMYTCRSVTEDCGEFPVEADEGDQALLDCHLPWHSLVVGTAEYHYSWRPALAGAADDFRVLVVTEDSSVVLNQLQPSDQGTYRCLLLDGNGNVLSQMHFLLTVTPSPSSTLRPLITLPALPHTPRPTDLLLSIDSLLSIISLVTGLSLIASIGLVVSFGLMLRRRTEHGGGVNM